MGCFSSSFSFVKWRFLHKPLPPKLVLNLFLFLCVCSSSLNDVALCDLDKSLLLQFKSSVSDPSGLLSSWRSISSDHCSWFGISCDSYSRVVSLNISGSGDKGNSSTFVFSDFSKFPLYGLGIRRKWGNGGVLVGKLTPLLGRLSELRILSLPFNSFESEVPDEIWGLKNLEVLDLEGNLINGLLPNHLTPLNNLRVLNLAFNKIEGDIPNSLAYSLRLETLNLAGNQLNGTIPGWIGHLRGAYLSFNWFTGSIPVELGGNCGKLEHLDLSGNYLVHGIPSSLGNCSQLRTLLLYSNMLEERIPSEIGQLQKLEVFDVSRNSLSGAIPHELGNCLELSVLVLSNLFDPLPPIKNMDGNPPIEEMSTDDFNFFQGAVPLEIARLPKLKILWAPRASLEGKFPSDWGSCENLQMMSLAQNLFSGEFPRSLSLCKKLQFLDLSSNKLSGELDKELSVPCMTVFDISDNHLSGMIPRFGNSSCLPVTTLNEHASEPDNPSSVYTSFFETKVREAFTYHFVKDDDLVVFHNFGHNNFTGGFQSMPIAAERLGMQTVYAYHAGENKLTGPFPGNLFENCQELGALIVNVSYNRISGQIPSHIGQMCSSLKYFDASGNQITGPISSSFGDLVSLDDLNLSRNLLEGHIPSSLGQIKNLRYLSLANNRLNGSIPSSLGQLRSLELLDLSSNTIRDIIPKELVNLRNLTVLLLTNNNLTGQIPSDLVNVTTLSVFNVSFNNLSGSLPLNNNFMKCTSALGNPGITSCPMSNLMVPSSDVQGRDGDASNYAASPPGSVTQTNGGNSFNSIEIASITSASAIVSVLLALIILFLYTRKLNPKSRVLAATRKEVTVFTDIGLPLNFDKVVKATGNFNASNCIGNGGFGATYKAEISPGVLVAIKRLSVGRFQGVQQFHAEVKTLGRLHHPNLVTLIGYHASETEMFLIYNYLPGGNLEKFIHERSTRAVDWRILHKIALDIARALAYLHDQCVPRVLHRDVKPSNILLDDELNACLSDFGLARLLGTSETHATTGVAGTFGYVAPEYAMTCRVSDKADVYSYGVVLLELISDKKALDPSFSPYGNGFNIVAWACMLLRQGRAKEFFTAGLWDVGPHDDLVEVLHLAVVCTVDSLSTRPTMKQVVKRLKQLQPPSC